MMTGLTVSYSVHAVGYEVCISDDGDCVDQYSAGNSRFCSHTYVHPDDDQALSAETLARFARQTAGEMAQSRGIPAESIEDHTDESAQWDIAHLLGIHEREIA